MRQRLLAELHGDVQERLEAELSFFNAVTEVSGKLYPVPKASAGGMYVRLRLVFVDCAGQWEAAGNGTSRNCVLQRPENKGGRGLLEGTTREGSSRGAQAAGSRCLQAWARSCPHSNPPPLLSPP